MDEGPEREASAKLAQHLAVAVQVAEAVIRLRQRHTERRTAGTEQAAAAARAERTATHAADRVVYSPALDAEWTRAAGLPDLGRAWGAAAGWADTDPVANVAATRVETRLAEMAPAAMARFDELRESGTDRVEAMRDVLAHVATESQYRPRVFVAEPAPSTEVLATGARVRADTAADEARQSEATPDDPATPRVGEHAEGVLAAVPRRDERGAWPGQVDAAAAGAADRPATDRQVGYLVDLLEKRPGSAGDRPTSREDIARLSRGDASAYIDSLGGGTFARRTTEAGYPHPADVAAESFPRPYVDVTPAAAAGTAATTTAAATKATTRTLSR